MSYDPREDSELLQQLREHEGFRPYAYRDSRGYLTIGIGRLVDKRKGGGITKEEAEYLLGNDVLEHARVLFENLPWVVDLDPVRRRVMIDLAFNMGVGGLLSFHRTLQAIEDGRWSDGAKGLLASKYARQVGKRARRLAKMLETGEPVSLSEV